MALSELCELIKKGSAEYNRELCEIVEASVEEGIKSIFEKKTFCCDLFAYLDK